MLSQRYCYSMDWHGSLAMVGSMPGNDTNDTNGSNDSSEDGHGAGEARTYTIDALASTTGVPSRTIRFYQAEGIVPPPRREGRRAVYDDTHRARLELITDLQANGLRLSAIREVLDEADSGTFSLDDWLRVGQQLLTRWSDDTPREISRAELRRLLGTADAPGVIETLLEAGLVVKSRRGQFRIESPVLLEMLLRLEAAGVDTPTTIVAAETIRRSMAGLAETLIALFADRVDEVFGNDANAIARAVATLRPIGQEAVRAIFAHEMDRALRSYVDEQAVAKVKDISAEAAGSRTRRGPRSPRRGG